MVPKALLQGVDGIDGEDGAEISFDIGYDEPRIIGNGAGGLHALGKRRHTIRCFQRILRRHHPPDLVEGEPVEGDTGDVPVAVVGGIERAAEQPDARAPFAHARLRGRVRHGTQSLALSSFGGYSGPADSRPSAPAPTTGPALNRQNPARTPMTETKATAIDATTITPRVGSAYPAPYDSPCAGRERQVLGNPFGLSDFGVNLLTLPPGAWSSQRHWHTEEDEFVYVLDGHPTLVTDAGRTPLSPVMCAGFPAGTGDGHHLVNETDRPVTCLEVGSRKADDDAYYSDIDLQIVGRAGGGGFSRKDGTPYDQE